MSAGTRSLTMLLWLGISAAALAQPGDRLYLQSPYDEIVLDEANSGAVLRASPINFPGRRMPSQADRQGELQFDLIDRPGEKFAVPWANIVDIRFFEQLVLAEADQHVRDGRFDVAQEYFLFLESKHPQTVGLGESIERFLYVQVGAAFRAQRYDEALALLVELYGRNPEMKGVATAYERVTSELVKRHLAAGNYVAARGLLKNLGERYPATMDTVVAPQQAQLQQDAEKLVAEARSLAAAGKRRQAHEAVIKSLRLWPAVAGGLELAESIHEQYPVVTVGVLASAPSAIATAGKALPRSLESWAAARTSRLLAQPIAAQQITDGTVAYVSPLGELVRGEDPRKLVLKLKEDLRWGEPQRPLTGADIAQTLLATADLQDAQFSPLWAAALGGVSVSGSEVTIELARPQPLTEGLLDMSLWMNGRACGPYRLLDPSPAMARFVPDPAFFEPFASGPAEIVERTYPDSAAALAALARGEISLIDRLSPWDVPGAADDSVVVRRYAVPTVHVLLVNPKKPLLRQRTMRRALVYGIDRQSILGRGLLGGQPLEGCDLLSGPFPRGAASDPFAYAYDGKIEPKAYEPGTAAILVRLAADEAIGAGQSLPSLVLAHPPGPIARVACQSITRQLSSLGVSVTLREEDAEATGDWDLRYVELSIREPLLDAWWVLGPGGLAEACSPAMLAALRQVQAASDQEQAAAALKAVHKLAAVELPVIPLWQLAEHCAVHASVQGVAERPGSLYENARAWKTALRVPAE
jgi:ABC-type transport system substrate-binding protein